jgi:hypothetical protein
MTTQTIDPKYLHGGSQGWMEEQESDTPTQIIYRRVGKDIDSNKWWWATCSSVNEAENLVNLLNGYEKKLAASKAEVERLKDSLKAWTTLD